MRAMQILGSDSPVNDVSRFAISKEPVLPAGVSAKCAPQRLEVEAIDGNSDDHCLNVIPRMI